MKLSKDIKPISYLKQNTAEAIRYVHEQQSPIVITQNGEAKAVLIDIAKYEQDQESFALLKMIAQSKAAYSSGDYQMVKKSFSDIRKNIKASQQ